MVGIKAKERFSKTGVTRKQSTLNFPKNEHFLPRDTHTSLFFNKVAGYLVCVSGGTKFSFFGKFGALCHLVTTVLRLALCLIAHDLNNVENVLPINPFHATGLIHYPLKTSKNLRYFQRVKKRDQWHKMV